MRRNRWTEWLLITAVALITVRAQGETFAHAQLRVTGSDAPACNSAKVLASAVERQLQRRVFDGPETDLIVTVSYRREQKGFEAEVQLSIPDGKALGSRRIRSSASQCTALGESLALAVAVMVDLTREDVIARQNSTQQSSESTGIVQHPIEEAAASMARETAPAGSWGEPRRWNAAVFISGLATIGRFPGIGWGGRLASDLRMGNRLSIELGVTALFGATVNDGPTSRARFVTYGSDLEVCTLVQAPKRIDWRFCAGMQMEIVRAQGTGYVTDRTEQTIVLEPLVKLDSTWWPTRKLGIRVGLGAVGTPIRHQYYATRNDGTRVPLFEPTFIAPFLIFGVGLRS